jgi:hypothetical protein
VTTSRGVTDLDAALSQQFLDVAVRQGRSAGTSAPPPRSRRPETGTRRTPSQEVPRSGTGQHASPVKPASILRSADATEPSTPVTLDPVAIAEALTSLR